METEVAHYGQWFALPDGIVNVICCDCGLTHQYVWKPLPADFEMRFDREQTTTDILREDRREGQYPLYDELVRLREENAELRRQLSANSPTPIPG